MDKDDIFDMEASTQCDRAARRGHAMTSGGRKIGVLLDRDEADPHECALIRALRQRPDVDLRVIVNEVAAAKAPTRHASGGHERRGSRAASVARSLAGAVAKLELLALAPLFARMRAHAARRDLRALGVSDVLRVLPLRTGSGRIGYSDQDLAKLERERFDLLVCAADGAALSDDVRHLARDGTVWIRLGHPECDHGKPAGFWEVYGRRPCSGFRIRSFAADEEGDVFTGKLPTQRTWALNVENLRRESSYYLIKILERYIATGKLPPRRPASTARRGARERPSVRQTSAYVLHTLLLYGELAARRLLLRKRERWHVAFVQGAWTDAVLRAAVVIENPEGHFYADPFLVESDGRRICFVEDYDYSSERGSIAAIELHGSGYRTLGTVIAEDFHMSFPFVFRVDGGLYMAPETSEKRELRVYRCAEFPMRWEYHCTLMKDVCAVDPMIFHRDGRWWLLVTLTEGDSTDLYSRLFVFHAETPFSTHWTRVGDLPAVFDSEKGRNAGLLEHEGVLFRGSQAHGFDVYGDSLRIQKIERLTRQDYAETEFRRVKPDFIPGIRGCHHMHSDGTYTVFDFSTLERERARP